MNISADGARALGTEVLKGLGASEEHAAVQVDQLVEADLRGRPSHGMQRLPMLVARIRSCVLDPAAVPTLDRAGPGALSVDGRNGFGPVAARAALGELVAAARSVGVAGAGIRRAGHIGMLAPYLEQIADAGLAALALTTSEALVHPAGGRTALVGTNPIGIAIPGGEAPLVVDVATGAISAGEVISHQQRGDQLPEGRAIDAEGRPTTDPTSALGGAISPSGGAKGYALGLGIELVVATLTGTSVGTAVTGTLDPDQPVTKGDVFVAMAPEALGGPPEDDRIGRYLEELRASAPLPDSDGVRIPGDRMRAERQHRLDVGLEYPDSAWAALTALSEEIRGEGG